MEKKFELDSNSQQLKHFREELRPLLKQTGLDDKASGEVLLALQEALTNIVRHSYGSEGGKIQVDFSEDAGEVRFSIRDFGHKFDLTQVPDPVLPRDKPGGLGIFLIKQLMDRVTYDGSCNPGNLLHLIKLKSSKPV